MRTRLPQESTRLAALGQQVYHEFVQTISRLVTSTWRVRRGGFGQLTPFARLPMIVATTAVAVLLCFGQDCVGARDASSTAGSPNLGMDPGIGPIAGWLEDLINDLTGTNNALAAALGIVAAAGGEIDQTDRQLLAQKLDVAEEHIDRILDPTQSPSLSPSDAGSIDRSYKPSSLTDHASDCVELSTAALVAAMIDPIPDEYIGTKIKTIKALLPEYRELAGIDE